MLHHLTLWVPDLGRAERSWSWLLGGLGYHPTSTARSRACSCSVTPTASRVALEQSPDMVPGMLYSRFRPGLNHLAFRVDGDLSMLA